MTLQICLERMRFYAYHGVLEQEQQVGNEFELNLVATLSHTASLLNDNLADTLNYAEVYDVIHREVIIPSLLLEHLAGRILKALFSSFDIIEDLEIKATKLHPPFTADIGGATVKVRMHRNEYSNLFSVSLSE